ncbi:MAG: hypothetical protein E6J62_06950 [Deltaproteobacteria bacterium]|nr:MAG: hypothetical protein E6J85_15500 [Deltaproteobacteria bacterium]TMB36604.1 MAG: hypothetical protein E6J62_06950 [Deltaproteobacteria bacterium]
MTDEVPDVCPTCNVPIDWSDWSRARVDESLVRDKAEIRMGRCGCSGKTYIQTRPGREPAQPGKVR